MSTMIARFNTLPRAAKWALYALAVIVVYFAVVEPALDARRTWSDQADAMQRRLTEERRLLSPQSEGGALREEGIRAYGNPVLPAAPDDFQRPASFEAAVNAVFAKYDVRKDQQERRGTVRQAEPLVGPEALLQRQELTIVFDATPKVVAQIVADLERTRLVTSVTRVRLDKPGARRSGGASGIVKATIGVETWLTTAKKKVAS